MDWLATTADELLGTAIRESQSMHRGDFSKVTRILLTDGRRAIVKNGDPRHP